MSNEKINVTLPEGGKELVVRYGDAEKIVDPHVYSGYTVKGVIGSVVEFLNKSVIDAVLIQNSYLTYSYDDLCIVLNYAQHTREKEVVTGNLQLSEDLKGFGINTSTNYSTEELGNLIRMNRHFFDNKADAMVLVGELKNFKAKVNKVLEDTNNDRGSVSKVYKHDVVESNIPAGFDLLIPIFKGYDKVRVPVEITIDVDFTCRLISPDLRALVYDAARELIGGEIDAVRALWPELRCFEV